MFKKVLIATIALCGAAPAAWSQATLISYETGIEASTDFVSLPGTAYGVWNFAPCAGCETVILRLDDKSQFLVGKQPVSLATLRKYAARGANHLDVFYETKTQRVTRLILRTQLDPADMPAKRASPGPARRRPRIEDQVMTTSRMRSLATLAAAATVALLASAPARADDTELFVGAAVAAAPSRPNILFVMDTSGSMDTNVQSQVPYDPAVTFSGSCNTNRVYWSRTGTAPACDSKQYVSADKFTCNAAQPNLNSSGIAYVALAAQWKPNNHSNKSKWQTLTLGDNSNFIECAPDAGLHGQTAASANKWAVDGSSGPWSSSSATKIDWSRGEPVTFYSGNYLNWKASPYVTRTRLEIMQNALITLLYNMQDTVNVGLMRYSNDTGSDNETAAQGGMVVKEIGKIEDNRDAMKTEINSWNAAGWTPLSETLYEATQYFRGDRVYFGGGSDATSYPERLQQVRQVHEQSQRRHAERHRFPQRVGQDTVRLAGGPGLPEELHRLPDGRPADTGQRGEYAASKPAQLCQGDGQGHVRRHRGRRQVHGRPGQVAERIGPASGPARGAKRHQLLDRFRR